MPSVLIEIRKRYTPDEEIARMDAVHAAPREAFTLLGDRNVRLQRRRPGGA